MHKEVQFSRHKRVIYYNMGGTYDLIVYGASGFTGQFVALHLAKVAQSHPMRWALGGRNMCKLQHVQQMIRDEVDATMNIPIVLADVHEDTALATLCRQTKILLNCTGPYRFYGEPVVKACIESKTHYLDITGEPEFMERMRVKYHDLAVANGVLVISACGFDSIPSDIGTVYTTQQFPKHGCASSIEAFIDIQNAKHGHYTTYECIVHGVSNGKELKKLRQAQPSVMIPYVGPRTRPRAIGFDKRAGKYFVRFPGADASIVRNSQKALVTNKSSSVTPVRFAVYFNVGSIIELLGLILFGIVLTVFSAFSYGKKLLLNYPGIFTLGGFTHEGPSREEMKQSTFSFTFYAKGYRNRPEDATQEEPDMEVVTRVSGPEAGYVATPIMFVASALCVLKKEVSASGGVLTTAGAFRDTSLISLLQAEGIKFETLTVSSPSA